MVPSRYFQYIFSQLHRVCQSVLHQINNVHPTVTVYFLPHQITSALSRLPRRSFCLLVPCTIDDDAIKILQQFIYHGPKQTPIAQQTSPNLWPTSHNGPTCAWFPWSVWPIKLLLRHETAFGTIPTMMFFLWVVGFPTAGKILIKSSVTSSSLLFTMSPPVMKLLCYFKTLLNSQVNLFKRCQHWTTDLYNYFNT